MAAYAAQGRFEEAHLDPTWHVLRAPAGRAFDSRCEKPSSEDGAGGGWERIHSQSRSKY